MRAATLLLLPVLLAACTTIPVAPQPAPPPEVTAPAPVLPDQALPEQASPEAADPTEPFAPAPTTPPTSPLGSSVVDVPSAGLGAAVGAIDPEPLLDRPEPFARLQGWAEADLEPALTAFRRSCAVFLKRPGGRALLNSDATYGRQADWAPVCQAAKYATHARPFFESLFVPVGPSSGDGLLTGYYETQIEARRSPGATFSEPILRLPADEATRRLPRAQLNDGSAEVIAYGRPVDVFFLHVQGSGRLHFPDGSDLRVGYAGNNGKKYKSIGRVLIERGQMTRDRSGKRSIEDWMEAAGPEAARELMNQNPRYIFFTEQEVAEDEGPRGAMQVPLTAMGSVAVDPSHRPYGVPVWLDTRLPRGPSDSQAVRTGLLVVTQDTGSAIRGENRGDLFFGSGTEAGGLAGVMKHRARWTVLIPRSLAARIYGQPAGSTS